MGQGYSLNRQGSGDLTTVRALTFPSAFPHPDSMSATQSPQSNIALALNLQGRALALADLMLTKMEQEMVPEPPKPEGPEAGTGEIRRPPRWQEKSVFGDPTKLAQMMGKIQKIISDYANLELKLKELAWEEQKHQQEMARQSGSTETLEAAFALLRVFDVFPEGKLKELEMESRKAMNGKSAVGDIQEAERAFADLGLLAQQDPGSGASK